MKALITKKGSSVEHPFSPHPWGPEILKGTQFPVYSPWNPKHQKGVQLNPPLPNRLKQTAQSC